MDSQRWRVYDSGNLTSVEGVATNREAATSAHPPSNTTTRGVAPETMRQNGCECDCGAFS